MRMYQIQETMYLDDTNIAGVLWSMMQETEKGKMFIQKGGQEK